MIIKTDSATAWLFFAPKNSLENTLCRAITVKLREGFFQTSCNVGPVGNPQISSARVAFLQSGAAGKVFCVVAGGLGLFWSSVRCLASNTAKVGLLSIHLLKK